MFFAYAEPPKKKQRGRDTDSNKFFRACQRGRILSDKLLRSIDINQVDEYGCTGLYLACMHGHSETVARLLSVEGIDVNATSGTLGMTPLYTACAFGHTNIVTQLLHMPAINANAKLTRARATPLWVACSKNHVDIVLKLLAHPGIDINAANREGSTPLITATLHNNPNIVHILLRTPGIDIKAQSKGKTAYDIAVEKHFHYIEKEIHKFMLRVILKQKLRQAAEDIEKHSDGMLAF